MYAGEIYISFKTGEEMEVETRVFRKKAKYRLIGVEDKSKQTKWYDYELFIDVLFTQYLRKGIVSKKGVIL